MFKQLKPGKGGTEITKATATPHGNLKFKSHSTAFDAH